MLAILPLEEEEYRTDFTNATSRAEFGELLARADEAVVQPPRKLATRLPIGGPDYVFDRPETALFAIGTVRTPRAGRHGGVVAEARERDMPIAWVHVGNRKARYRPATTLPMSRA